MFLVPKGPLEQIDEIAKDIYKETKKKHFGANVWYDHRTDYPVAFARNESEFASLLREAEEIVKEIWNAMGMVAESKDEGDSG